MARARLEIYSYMVSAPEYYQVCKDVIGEVAEVFDYPGAVPPGYGRRKSDYAKKNEYCVIRQFDLLGDARHFRDGKEKVYPEYFK